MEQKGDYHYIHWVQSCSSLRIILLTSVLSAYIQRQKEFSFYMFSSLIGKTHIQIYVALLRIFSHISISLTKIKRIIRKGCNLLPFYYFTGLIDITKDRKKKVHVQCSFVFIQNQNLHTTDGKSKGLDLHHSPYLIKENVCKLCWTLVFCNHLYLGCLFGTFYSKSHYIIVFHILKSLSFFNLINQSIPPCSLMVLGVCFYASCSSCVFKLATSMAIYKILKCPKTQEMEKCLETS